MAGGKGQLLGEILPKLTSFNNYYEPFVGAGAVFWGLLRRSSDSQPTSYYHLSDINQDLIDCYLAVRDDLGTVLKHLDGHLARHGPAYFYQVRGLGHDISWMQPMVAARAARMIYLNKSGHSGLWRVNSQGQYNVSYGNYARPTVNYDVLQTCSIALRQHPIHLTTQDFETAVATAVSGDLVYFDPPYIPLSETASFTAYTTGGFGLPEHYRLAALCQELDRRGVLFVQSNADTPLVHQLYSSFRVELVRARRAVNINASQRYASEVLITNIE